jgi:serine/threonine protein kinase/Tol biopolymer transport system component
MTLATGSRLGPYEILSPLGAGGMGEVYKARDTRLDRTVAVKVLAEHLSSQPELRARFEREARTISTLDHPHICVLHDVGRQDGVDYLVMEYLEGETLGQRLQRGHLPLAQVLLHASEIAAALDRAHRAGVVHRDLKPGNVMLTRSGAKLLDFGLAKLRKDDASDEPSSKVATLTGQDPLTGKGTLLGTFRYMAPEQLEGKDADARSDIFAFGSVLYEMATGQRAFDATSQASLIAAILDKDPPPIASLVPMTPPALDRLVRGCLAKNPDDRWQSAHDVQLALKWVEEADGASPAAAAGGLLQNRKRWAWGLAAILLAIVTPPVVRQLAPRPESPRLVRAIISPTLPTTFEDADAPVISPDGRLLAFTGQVGGKRSLWVRALDSQSARSLPDTDRALQPFWSPDSRSIGFFTSDLKLKRVAASGGPVLTLAGAAERVGVYNTGGTWNRAGVILFGAADGPILRTSESGGAATPLTVLDKAAGDRSHRLPHFLPDGRHFLYVVESADRQRAGVHVGSLESSQTKRVLDVPSTVWYSPPGYLLFLREGALMTQRFDATRLLTTGEPSSVAPQVLSNFGSAAFSVSMNGVLAYRAPTEEARLAWFGREGRRGAHVGERAPFSQIDLSPDERRVAAQIGRDVWLVDLNSGIHSRLTFDPAQSLDPVWSPDGRRVLFARRKGHYNLFAKTIDSGQEEVVFESDEDKYPEDWSGDGRFILYGTYGGITLYALPLGDRKPVQLVDSAFWKNEFHFSPDGRWIAYNSEESGRMEIHLASFPDFGNRRQVSNGGGVQALWRGDGRELFYLGLDARMMTVDVKVGPVLETGVPRALFQTRIPVRPWADQYCVTRDGQRFLVIEPPDEPGAIELVLNWTAALERP